VPSFPHIGKIGKEYFDGVVYPHLGRKREEVVIGPAHGCDNAVIKINERQVMVVTTDPLSIIPALGIEDSAWLSVHLLASDLVTSGIAPQYAVFDLNLPVETTSDDFETYWKAIHEECTRLGIAIVAGHTGKFIGCNYTVVGGGMMIGISDKDSYVAPTMARPGDHVIVTKGAAIATTGILARVFPETVARSCGREVQSRCAELFRDFSVVTDALTAARVGLRENGVTAMHDATEGGVFGALHEIATASNCGIRIRRPEIPLASETRQVCSLFDLDPYVSLSEGTLVIAARPEKVSGILSALREKSIRAADVGVFLPPSEGMWVETEAGLGPLVRVEADPYWQAYAQAVEKGWK
jgi:hydrogenase expression/formation protein HypE